MEKYTDQKLIEMLAGQEPQRNRALEILYNYDNGQFRKSAFAVIRQVNPVACQKDPHFVFEVFHQSLEKLVRKAQDKSFTIYEGHTLTGYLIGICRTKSREPFRKGKIASMTTIVDDPAQKSVEVAPSPEDLFTEMQSGRWGIIKRAVYAMKHEKCRKFLINRHLLLKARTLKEIADFLGIAERTADYYSSECKKKLKALVEQDPEFSLHVYGNKQKTNS